MSQRELRLIHPPAPPERRQILPNAVLGTAIFVMAEIMLFAGLVSAHAIAQSNGPMWPPPDQPRLPIEETLINTAALLASGVLIWQAGRRFATSARSARPTVVAAVGLGAFFVLFQGFEWVALVGEGLTMTTSQHAGFFYLIVGIHALHAVGGLAALFLVTVRLFRGTLSAETFWAARLFWYFVVLLWPLLYWRVYW